jgi:hypothetical protein
MYARAGAELPHHEHIDRVCRADGDDLMTGDDARCAQVTRGQ